MSRNNPHGTHPIGEHGRHPAGDHGKPHGDIGEHVELELEEREGEHDSHGKGDGTGHNNHVTKNEIKAGEETRKTEAERAKKGVGDNLEFFENLVGEQDPLHPNEENIKDEHVSYEGEEHFEESMNEFYLKEHLRPEERDIKRFQKEFASIQEQFHLTKITDKGPELNRDGYKIEAADAVRLLSDPRYADCVRILDLRDPENWAADDYASKIKGAIEFPLVEASGPDGYGKIDKYGGYDPSMAETEYMAQRNQQQDQARLDAWRENIANPGSPFRKIASHSIILVHCLFSGNRTPKFATGLVRYFARPNGQTVVILTGGLEAFKAAAIAAGKPELLETRDQNNYPKTT